MREGNAYLETQVAKGPDESGDGEFHEHSVEIGQRWKKLTNMLLSSTMALTLLGQEGKKMAGSQNAERNQSAAGIYNPRNIKDYKIIAHGDAEPDRATIHKNPAYAPDSPAKIKVSLLSGDHDTWVLRRGLRTEDRSGNSFKVVLETDTLREDEAISNSLSAAKKAKKENLPNPEHWRRLSIEDLDEAGSGTIFVIEPAEKGMRMLTFDLEKHVCTNVEEITMGKADMNLANRYLSKK